ncbi:THO complex subunit 4-like [Homalodisca vitripennis]|uniref:THO complex subunit 4-like n=1 Tax=Homalodisca vitripennis TaxID=197043 RepID=UPI001EEA76F4|nr:THO complex subunit 4-like [Homalodisca vitripennis]
MEAAAVRGLAFSWFRSFLTGREQRVRVGQTCKGLKNSTRRSHERGGFRQGGASQSNARDGGGPMRSRRVKFDSSIRVPYSRPPGDINSRWQLDLYDGPVLNKRRRSGGLIMTGGPTKLVVSNLDYGILSSDIQVLFSKFGPLHSATVNYEKSGRSMGSAYVVFERKADAVRAMKQYNRVPLDGRPMHIELTTSDVKVMMQQGNRFNGGFTHRPNPGRFGFRRNGRGEGRRGGRGGKKVPTAAELDAELDAYISEITLCKLNINEV